MENRYSIRVDHIYDNLLQKRMSVVNLYNTLQVKEDLKREVAELHRRLKESY